MRTLYSQGKGNGKLCQIVREAECTSINNDAFILHTLIVHPALQPLTTDYNYSYTHTITTRRPVQLSVALVVMPMRCCRRSPRLVVGSACRERQFSCSLPCLLTFGSLHILGFERAATSIHHPPIAKGQSTSHPSTPDAIRRATLTGYSPVACATPCPGTAQHPVLDRYLVAATIAG